MVAILGSPVAERVEVDVVEDDCGYQQNIPSNDRP